MTRDVNDRSIVSNAHRKLKQIEICFLIKLFIIGGARNDIMHLFTFDYQASLTSQSHREQVEVILQRSGSAFNDGNLAI